MCERHETRIAELERELALEREIARKWHLGWKTESRRHADTTLERDRAHKELEQLREQLRDRTADCKRAYAERDAARDAARLYPDTRAQELEAQVHRLREENERLRRPMENSMLPLELEDGTIYRISTVGALQRIGPPPWMTLEVWSWAAIRTYRYVLER